MSKPDVNRGKPYLEYWDQVAHLGRIFGPDNWDNETDVKLVAQQERAEGGKWDVVYLGKTTLIIRDPDGFFVCKKDGIATGAGENLRLAEAHDLGAKAAASDSLKRATIALGNQFGLGLYNDEAGRTYSALGRSLAHPEIGRADWLAVVEALKEKETIGG